MTPERVKDELADAMTCLDLWAHRLGIDPGQAVIDKFNRVSLRRGSPRRLPQWN